MSSLAARRLHDDPTWAPAPPIYRCYFVDLADVRRVIAVEVLDSPDDAAATLEAVTILAERNRGRLRYGGIELWDRERLVHVHPPVVVPGSA